MKKLLVVLVSLVGLIVLVRKFGPKMQNVDWEKRFERMPDNAPPKWMFSNISAIRENTDRILDVLGEGREESSAPDAGNGALPVQGAPA